MRVHFEVAVFRDWRPLDPRESSRQLGGTERLALEAATRLAHRGHTVTFRGGGRALEHDGVRFLADGQAPSAVDVAVCVQAEPPPDLVARRTVAWSCAAQYPRRGPWDAVVALSSFHADLLRGRLPDARIETISPGCTLPEPAGVTRDRFLYSSSPDRGLHRLLAIWPDLWDAFHTPLAITYDLRGVLQRHAGRADLLGLRLRTIAQLLDQPGVIVHGPLDPDDMHQLRARSRSLLYPLDPVIPHSELLSLAVLQACAAGCPPVLAPVDCFPSEYSSAATFVRADSPAYDAGAWIDAIAREVEDEPASSRARQFAATRTWDRFTDAWEELLEDVARESAVSAAPHGQSWIALSVGEGRGEAAILRPVLDAAVARGHQVRLITDRDENAAVLDGPWETLVATSRPEVDRLLGTGSDRIVLSSSALFLPLLPDLPRIAAGVPVVSLEFSWPRWLVGTPGAEHIRRFIIAMPQSAWQLGLELGREAAPVPQPVVERSRCVGFVGGAAVRTPSADGSRRILLYFGSSPGWVSDLQDVLARTLQELRHEHDIAADYVCGSQPLDLPDWVSRIPSLTFQQFNEQVCDADLVISSGGAGTTAAAALAGTPHMALTPGLVYDAVQPGPAADLHAHVMTRCGYTEHLAGRLQAASYLRLCRKLLTGRRHEQEVNGARHAVRLIEAEEPIQGPRTWSPAELHP